MNTQKIKEVRRRGVGCALSGASWLNDELKQGGRRTAKEVTRESIQGCKISCGRQEELRRLFRWEESVFPG